MASGGIGLYDPTKLGSPQDQSDGALSRLQSKARALSMDSNHTMDHVPNKGAKKGEEATCPKSGPILGAFD